MFRHPDPRHRARDSLLAQWALFLLLAVVVRAANGQGCDTPEELLTEAVREARQASARAKLGRDAALVDVRHCFSLTAIGPAEAAVWFTESTFVYEPYAISHSEFSLDVVRCPGFAMEYSCETQTESHYFRGDLSFSVRLLDGVGVDLAARIVDATMSRGCGPRLPGPDSRLSFFDRVEISRGEAPGEYRIGTRGCALNLKVADEDLTITGMRVQSH